MLIKITVRPGEADPLRFSLGDRAVERCSERSGVLTGDGGSLELGSGVGAGVGTSVAFCNITTILPHLWY